MNDLIEELIKENENILHKNPKLAMMFDWSSDAYRLQYNEKMISKLKNLALSDVMQWVSVKDAMPKKSGVYVCMRSFKNIISVENYYVEHPENWLNFTGVTHWMEVKKPCA